MNRQNHRWDVSTLAEKLDFRMDIDRAVQKKLKKNGGTTMVTIEGPGPVYLSSDEEVVRQLLPLPFRDHSNDIIPPSDLIGKEYHQFRNCFDDYKKIVEDPNHQIEFFISVKKMIFKTFNRLDSGHSVQDTLQSLADQLVSDIILGSVFKKISTPVLRNTRSYHRSLGKGLLIHSVFKNPIFAKSLYHTEDVGMIKSEPDSLSQLWMNSNNEMHSPQSLSYLLKDLALGSGDPVWWKFNTRELNLNARMMTESILHTIPGILEHIADSYSIQDRLFSEIDSCNEIDQFDSLLKLPFLDAVCKEGLRMHPVFPITLVSVVRPMRVKGDLLRPGTVAGIANRVLHGDSLQWYLPDRFIPERFIGRSLSSVHYLPFGVLPDHSPSSGIILATMKVLLVYLVSRFRVCKSELCSPLSAIMPKFLRYKRGGAKILLEERFPARLSSETIKPIFQTGC